MTTEIGTAGPSFVTAYRPDRGGVDFLGMRQANLDMIYGCLPGINNVTWYIRPFALVSWMYWKFHAHAKAEGLNSPSRRQLAVWTQKVETLFTWGHKLQGISNIPGRDSEPPVGDLVPLDFEAWGRVATNTSLMAAVQYGPAAKTLDGLGFLEPVDGPFYRTVGEGVRLAEALDDRIQKVDSVGALGDIRARRGNEDLACKLYRAWSVSSPSRREQQAFQKAFYDPMAVGRSHAMGRRSTTVAMIITLLSRAKSELTIAEVRRGLFHGRLASKHPLFSDDGLVVGWTRWRVLQVRQVQRLALEGLLSWCESRLVRANERTTEQIVGSTISALSEKPHLVPADTTVGAIFTQLKGKSRTLDDLLARSDGEPDFDPFVLMQTIVDAIHDRETHMPALCLRGLFLSLLYCEAFQKNDFARSLTQVGAPERLSLAHSFDTLVRCREWSIADFLQLCFENLILSQHFSVAARRFDGRTQRLRISIGENGLEFLADEPLIPTITQDRLRTALSLMADCGLIRRCESGDAYRAL